MVTIVPPPLARTLPPKSAAAATDDLLSGLASDEARHRLEKFGPNAMPDTSAHPLRRARVVAWIAAGDAPPHPSSSSGDADGNRASQLRHAIQDVDGDTNFCASAFVLVEAQPIADYLLISTDRGLDTTSHRIA
jgi:hypothetical protein